MPEAVQMLHDFRFPGESEEYRRARDELLQAEVELRRQIERVAAQRRGLPPGGAVPTDYEFDEWDAAAGGTKRVRLSELFNGRDTLFLYSFMIVPAEQGLPFVGPCPSCTSIIDGIDGALPHITQRIAFAAAAGGSDRGVPSPRREPGVAARPPAVCRAQQLQPRLRRRGRERFSVADRQRVRAA